MNVRRRNSIQKGMKDYMVPIIGGVLIIILIFSVFSWWGNEPTQIDLENKVWLTLNMDSSATEGYIEYPWNFKKKIEWDISLYKWEKVIVKDGTVSLSLPWVWSLKLNKLWEFKYLENGDFDLSSSDLWLNSVLWINVGMTFADVKVGDNTNISFSQNEVWSTIYLINGFAEVINLAGKSTVLANWQKITISRLDANNEDIDISLLKESIDDYYKQSDWFIKNNWNSFLNKVVEEEDGSWAITETNSTSDNMISITNLSDGSTVSSDKIIITWNYSDEEIVKITVNWKEAKINSWSKTFKFENISVWNKENDLVFKVYDDANDLLSKFIYIVYNDWASTTTTSTSKFNVQTFDVDGSQFIFSTIKDWVSKKLNWKTTYTTYGDFLTIYWNVTAKWIKNVSVNWYTLNSFNWSTWRYHPSILNNNLSIWTNVYEIKYSNDAWKVVYTNHFTIIKKKVAPKVEEKIEEKETDIISSEASIN